MRNQFTPNEITVNKDIAYIELYNKKNKPIAKAMIDSDDIAKVENRKWCLNDQGYVISGYGKGRVRLHHIILDFKYRYTDNFEIDHINTNPLDNRKSNLRKITHQQNISRQKISKVNTSGYKGVCYDKNTKGWKARIFVKGKYFYLGQFKTKEEAAIAYNDAAIKHFGEFANFGKPLWLPLMQDNS